MNAKGQKLADTLTQAGVNVRDVLALGSFVHIDSYKKYADIIMHLMTSAGFVCVKQSDSSHMDNTTGYRVVFTVSK